MGPPHLSPVPDWLGAIARPMMCRHWAPGARQPGRTAVRSPDMTLNRRRWVNFGGANVRVHVLSGSYLSMGTMTAIPTHKLSHSWPSESRL